MKFSTVILFATSATAGVLDLGFQRRRVTHDPEAATTGAKIEAPRALELAMKVRHANKGGNDSDNLGSAASNSTALDVESSAANSTSTSSSSSSGAQGSAAAAAAGSATSSSPSGGGLGRCCVCGCSP
ncbi:hypothetical protein PG994_003309 [Apiospora phragmitis]|uniref:Uncharacterized protein n=1 Tax=Apiospora phragmitis TaxID=2905665 RepID=A0ABR1VXS8_9PEZI